MVNLSDYTSTLLITPEDKWPDFINFLIVLMIMGLDSYGNSNDLPKLSQCEDRLSFYNCCKSLVCELVLRCNMIASPVDGVYYIVGAP